MQQASFKLIHRCAVAEIKSRLVTICDGHCELSHSGEIAFVSMTPGASKQAEAKASISIGGVLIAILESCDLADGDVVYIDSVRGRISTYYRRASNDNSILVTEECNSNCIMCSQPPLASGTIERLPFLLDLVSQISPQTASLGFTGGEPLLLGRGFLDLLQACKSKLPQTMIHILSNGRLFYYQNIVEDIAAVGHPNLVFGVPVFADNPWDHDYVVQSPGAFRQTILGLQNAARAGLRVEVRQVLQAATVPRLSSWARFVANNLTFAEHVAIMGLEIMGHTNKHRGMVWIDPADYQIQLKAAVAELRKVRLNVSIYNLPLCTIPVGLWPYAKRSISEWKNVFFPECVSCLVRERCSGAFHSGQRLRSRLIQPFTDHDALALTERGLQSSGG